jgi:phosphoribosylamine-glycine ligase
MKNQGIQLDFMNSKETILKLIDDQINNCKIEYMKAWERDHSTSAEVKDKKIKDLNEKKEEIKAYFKRCEAEMVPVELNFLNDMGILQFKATA